MITEKKCTKCKKTQPIENFHKGDGAGGKRSYCRECGRLYLKKWRTKNPERYRELSRNHSGTPGCHNTHLQRKYGITLAQYNKMHLEQGNLCAICQEENNINHRLYVDHNHKTGKVRALLCQRCNLIIGMAKEKPQVLLKIIEYLIKDQNDANADSVECCARIHSG